MFTSKAHTAVATAAVLTVSSPTIAQTVEQETGTLIIEADLLIGAENAAGETTAGGRLSFSVGLDATVSRNAASGEWNVIFIDVFNEPHDVAPVSWGDWSAGTSNNPLTQSPSLFFDLTSLRGTQSFDPASGTWSADLGGIISMSASNDPDLPPWIWYPVAGANGPTAGDLTSPPLAIERSSGPGGGSVFVFGSRIYGEAEVSTDLTGANTSTGSTDVLFIDAGSTLTFTFVPAPGAALPVAVMGIAVTHRRRGL
ncbi:MAG: hypothetical protein AAGB51_13535 [Planctomycetota bacterium]